jgi:four helix bundle protein
MMAVRFEELKVLQVAEEVADQLWKIVVVWEGFAKDTVGKQLVRAMDSVGANIAESYGRYHYEDIEFLTTLPATSIT